MRPSCKEKILDAADDIAREGGASKLTLDAAAERAGVSKGGVLYHFPTKESLLVAMVARSLDRFAERRKALAAEQQEPGAALKGDILTLLKRNPEENRKSAAMLAAVANDPNLLEPALVFQKQRFCELAGKNADEDFARRAICLLAADGILLFELLDIAPFTKKQREVLMETLLRMAEEVSARQ